jgi:hypothetical protein
MRVLAVAVFFAAACSSSSAPPPPTAAQAWVGMWSCTGPAIINGVSGYSTESFNITAAGADSLSVDPINNDGGLVPHCTLPFTIKGANATITGSPTCNGNQVAVRMFTLSTGTITGTASVSSDAGGSTGSLVCTMY